MKITPEFLAELKAKALAATPGPWKVQTNAPLIVTDSKQSLHIECALTWGNSKQNFADMKYVAMANPQNIIALIQDVHRLYGCLKELADKCQQLDPTFDVEAWRKWWEGWNNG